MKCPLLLAVLCLSSVVLAPASLAAQAQTAAPPAAKLTFDVASVRENKSGYPPTGDMPTTNLALGPGSVYNSAGGLVSIRNFPLTRFITFAYKLTNAQVKELYQSDSVPNWAKASLYDIQARTDKPNVTKDELRLMMQSLLADRFGVVAQFVAKNEPVLAMRLVKPGTLGPRLRAHPASEPCSRVAPQAVKGEAPPPVTLDNGFPVACGGMLVLPTTTPKEWHVGGRDVSMADIAGDFGDWGGLDRTLVDSTGLTGNFDFALDFVPKQRELPPGATPTGEELVPNFIEQLRKQMGLKLDAEKQDVQVLVISHITPLTDN